MKRCPKCGKMVSYNSYFGGYICDGCNWEKMERRGRYTIRVKSSSLCNSVGSKKTTVAEVGAVK